MSSLQIQQLDELDELFPSSALDQIQQKEPTCSIRKRAASVETTDLDKLSRPSTLEQHVTINSRAKMAEQYLIDPDSQQAWQQLGDLEKVSVNVGKAMEEFRNYKDSSRQDIVELHYKMMRKNQSFSKVAYFEKKYHSFDKCEMTIWEAFEALKGYVDSSDPDSELPNLEHMLQTAEAIREAGHPDWMILCGLIHDMGKIMYLWGTAEDGQIGRADFPQWGLGGDTWVVGCPIPSTVVFPEYNSLNSDENISKYQTITDNTIGIYEKGCGLKNLKFAYGHDEYLYQLLKYNKTTIPTEGLAMIRYHSCYPLHQCNEYKELLEPGDEQLLGKNICCCCFLM
jgi:inositol oxygenase